MEDDEIKKLYSMLDDVNIKSLHEYKLEIKSNGINLYPIKSEIYILHSLVKKILDVNPCANFYINFENKYVRII